jgi:MazG nucleotide pyrophosphohydrolase domain.
LEMWCGMLLWYANLWSWI